MLCRILPAALASLLIIPACTLDLDRDEDPVSFAPDAGHWDDGPDGGGPDCWDGRCPDGGVRPDPSDAGVGPDGDAGSPACDAGRPFPEDAGTPPDRDGGIDPWPDAGGWPVPGDAGVPPERDGGIDPWPSGDAGIDPRPADDAGAGGDCGWITDEAICIVSPGCVAWYEGVDCVCDDEGHCDCAEWVFSHCE